MLKPLKKIDYRAVIKYAVIFLAFLLTENLESTPYPYSVAVFSSAITEGASVIVTPPLLILSLIAVGKSGLLLSTAVSAVIIVAVNLIYKKFNAKPTFENVFYTLASLSVFLAVGSTTEYIPFDKRLYVSLFTALLTFIFTVSVKALSEKGLKRKLGYEELAVLGASAVVMGVGISNFVSPSLWKGISVFSLLIACYLYKLGTGTFISCLLGVPLAVYYGNLTYLSVYILFGTVAQIFIKNMRHVSSLSLIICDYAVQALFNAYGGFYLENFIPVCIGAFLFSAIPSSPLKNLKEKLYQFREKQLVRESINRNRIMLSNRLYELSGVFSEMSSAFSSFKKTGLTSEKAKEQVIKEIKSSVCASCEKRQKCSVKEKAISDDLNKLLDIGFAKGKLSLIDLPSVLSETCGKPNNLLYLTNKLLAEYRNYTISFDNVNNGRDLIAREAEGVSEMLKGVAFESGTLLTYQGRLERNLAQELFKKGFTVTEILIYGEKENTSVSVITDMKEFSVTELNSVISKVINMPMTLCEKNQISEEKSYFLFRVKCKFDAVFGMSYKVKDGSTKSGDTHSVERITENKFLVALSDGMGSGERAQNVSSVSLSLIESFYKAGLNSELILNTVNRLLSINEEDDFTALDLSVVDLKTGKADFIKYGSPYGFIICDEGIKIVEGNTLPLGILTELKPSVCSTTLKDGDVIILLTDGISDAFGNSSAIIDFLRTQPAKNPQTLCDTVVEKAVSLKGGIKNDDMTALAVRIFNAM